MSINSISAMSSTLSGIVSCIVEPVIFDIADDDVGAFGLLSDRGFEHRVGFAHACRHAEKDLELATRALTLLLLDRGEQRIGVWANVIAHAVTLVGPAPGSASKH